MSQTIFADIVPGSTSGNQLAGYLNDFKAAMMSGLSGNSRPAALLAGGTWVDISQQAMNPSIWTYKLWTGTQDIVLFTLNLTTNTLAISGSNDVFKVSKQSDDTVGAILQLFKERATAAQVQFGDTVGELQFIGADSSGGFPLVSRIRTVAVDTMTNAASGAQMIFETVLGGGVLLTEWMRFLGGKIGMGVAAPENTLHVRGLSGIKSERYADDTNGASLTLKKRRVTGTGAAQAADILGALQVNTLDSTTADNTVVSLVASANEAHTGTARGATLKLQTVKSGTNALSDTLTMGDALTSAVPFAGTSATFSGDVAGSGLVSAQSLALGLQSIPTAASVTALSALKAIVNFTGSTPTALNGIDSAGKTKVILLHNGSSASVTLKHQASGELAINRFKLPLGRDINLSADSSVELFYSTVELCWKLKSGSGSGGGALAIPTGNARATPTVLDGTTAVPVSQVDSRQFEFVQGNGAVTMAANPQIAFPSAVGTELILQGVDDTQTITFINGNGISLGSDESDVTLYKDTVLSFIYDGANWVLKRG